MGSYRRIIVTEKGEVTVVKFKDRKIIDSGGIQELANELYSLVEKENRQSLLLNFVDVDFLSSAALNKLIILGKKVKTNAGKLRLCNLHPEIYQIFAITNLTKEFEIKEDEADALESF